MLVLINEVENVADYLLVNSFKCGLNCKLVTLKHPFSHELFFCVKI